ncbi:MAG: hypothetical protein HP008_02860 [Clostridia bacterium]|nr:hypothetical protein [Clostridia bacterium]
MDSGETNNLKRENFAWLDKLRYEKSFTAKLLLADRSVKDYYALIVGEILSYDKTRARNGWGGVAFTAGKNAFARVEIKGKTLYVYLAGEAEDCSSLKYKAAAVGDKKKYEKTPSVLKIKSEGAAKNAVKQIEKLAERFSLTKKTDGETIPFVIKPESFDNLVARGLIRVINKKSAKPEAEEADKTAPEQVAEEEAEAEPETRGEELSAYEDTVLSKSELLKRHGLYGKILSDLSGGVTEIKSSEKLTLKALDEGWIEKVENALSSIDFLLRNPTRYIAETEEVLPIELTRKITGRSIAHLSMHTDYISEVKDDGTVTPTKLLNIFREDSYLTYENKFLNTLINRLYFFVTERFRLINKQGADEKSNVLDYETQFFSGEKRGTIKISINLSEEVSGSDSDGIKSVYSSPLYKRAEKLDTIVKSYINSDFCKELGRNFIRPPVMRTNAILKNKYFRDCLELWEFIESYDDSGLGITVKENVFTPDEACVNGLYGSAAVAFLEFLHGTNADERTLSATYETPSYSPIISEMQEKPDETAYDVTTKTEQYEPNTDELLINVLAALEAEDEYLKLNPFTSEESENVPESEETAAVEEVETADETAENAEEDPITFNGIRYVKSFEAKLRLSADELKERFIGIMNRFGEYKVGARKSFSCMTISAGRTRIARITIKGKTLCLYTALTEEDCPDKYELYRLTDCSDIKRYEKTPAKLKIKSDRAFNRALALIDILAEKYSLKKAKTPVLYAASDYPESSFEELLAAGLIRESNGNASVNNADSAANDQTVADNSIITAETVEDSVAATLDGESEQNGAVTDGSIENSSEPADAIYEEIKERDDLKSFEYGDSGNPFEATPMTEFLPNTFDALKAEEKNAIDEVANEPESKTLPGILYPDSMDYSRPALKGVDDVKGFISDEKESKTEAEESGNKVMSGMLKKARSLFSRKRGGRR